MASWPRSCLNDLAVNENILSLLMLIQHESACLMSHARLQFSGPQDSQPLHEVPVNSLSTYWNSLSNTQKTAAVVAGGLAMAASGGAIASAVAGTEALLVVAGPVMLATGRAAVTLASRIT